LKWTRERTAAVGGTSNDLIAANLAAVRRRRIWRIVIAASVLSFVAAIAGCLFMMRTRGVQVEVERMRNEVGELLTAMVNGGVGESFARHIPRLVDVTAQWDRKFAERSESFRGLSVEIDQVQEMHRLGVKAEGWRKELEVIAPTQRGELWQKSIKPKIVAEQKKWPNRTHEKGASEWMQDFGKEFWYGVKHGFSWPVGLYQRMAELIRGGGAISQLDAGDCLRYLLFPYRLSGFTVLRLAGIVLTTTGLGYALCWLGLKTRLGWLSYAGLINFLYLLNIALFILYLEVTK